MDEAEKAKQIAEARALLDGFKQSGTFHSDYYRGGVTKKRATPRRQISNAYNGSSQGAMRTNLQRGNATLTSGNRGGSHQHSYAVSPTYQYDQTSVRAGNKNHPQAQVNQPAPADRNLFAPAQTDGIGPLFPMVTRLQSAATRVDSSAPPTPIATPVDTPGFLKKTGAMANSKSPACIRPTQTTSQVPVTSRTQSTISNGVSTVRPTYSGNDVAGISSTASATTPVMPVNQVTPAPQPTIAHDWDVAINAIDQAEFGDEELNFDPIPAVTANGQTSAVTVVPSNTIPAINEGLLGTSRHATTDVARAATPSQPASSVVPAVPAGHVMVWEYQDLTAEPVLIPVVPEPEMSDEMDIDEPMGSFRPTIHQHGQNPEDCTCVGLNTPVKGLGKSRWASPNAGDVVNTGMFTYAGGHSTGTCPLHDVATRNNGGHGGFRGRYWGYY